MASINAKLIINETGNGVVYSVSSNIYTNNISELPYTRDLTTWFLNQTETDKNYGGAIVNVINSSNNNKYGFTKYGIYDIDGSRYNNKYNGLMFKCPRDLTENFQLTISGRDIIAFNIYFDSAMGQKPLEYTVYSSITGVTTTYSNSTNVIIISGLPSGEGYTTITITQWANQNVPIAITFFENVELELDMNKNWIDSFETQTQKTSNPSSIEYGILGNTGSIKLIDKNKKLYEYSRLGYLNMNLFSLYLFINGKQIQHHISTMSPYYDNNNTLSLELSNDIQNWKNIIVPSKNYTTSNSLKDVLKDLLTTYLGYSTTEFYNLIGSIRVKIFTGVEIETDLNGYLQALFFNGNFTLNQGNLVEQINKVCQVAMLNCYIKDNKELTFSSARPVKLNDEKIIKVPYRKQYETFDYSILVDNRYDTVTFDNDTTTSLGNKNIIRLQSNEIMPSTTYGAYGDNVKTLIKSTIRNDYSNGIKNANLKVFPSDYYYMDGTLAKNWNNGDIFEIGDIIDVQDGNNESIVKDINGYDTYFRIVDRKVIYEGQVLIELSLQEIKN